MKRDDHNWVWPASPSATWPAVLSRSLRESLLRHEALRRRCIRKATTRDLHDLRVESRRQLAFVALADGLGARRAGKARRPIKQCLRDSSELRDLEVLLALVNQLRPEYPELTKFHRRLRHRKRAAREKTQRRLQRDQHKRKHSRHVEALVEVMKRLPASEASVAGITRMLGNSAKEVQKRSASALRDEAQLHAARVALKQLRYMVESLADLLPGANKSWTEKLRQAQHAMGEIHDLDVLAAEMDRYMARRAGERSRLRDARATIAERARRLHRALGSHLPSVPANLRLRAAKRARTPAR